MSLPMDNDNGFWTRYGLSRCRKTCRYVTKIAVSFMADIVAYKTIVIIVWSHLQRRLALFNTRKKLQNGKNNFIKIMFIKVCDVLKNTQKVYSLFVL